MRALVLVVVLCGCSPNEPTIAADASPGEPDAEPDPDEPIALEPGVYDLEWTCLDGCGPLAFPPGTYTELVVSEGYDLTWRTAEAVNEQAVTALAGDSLCVEASALSYSSGSTAPIQFCPEIGGPVADVTYTANVGPMPVRVYRVKAMPPG